jgi:hypothetical protein
MAIKIEPGLRLGKLVVLEEVERGRSDRRWCAQCDCGALVTDSACHLRKRTSCGSHACRKTRSDGNGGHASHDKSKRPPEYNVWCSMRKRCRNPNSDDFGRYGGRGIAVCARWDRFDNFLADMGRRPSPKHSLDRIDNDGDYEPGNCRWVTSKEQMRNRRDNVWMSYGNGRAILADWARLTGLPEKVLQSRKRLGWSDERALTTPPRRDRRRGKPIDFRHPDRFIEDIEDALSRAVHMRVIV